MALSNGVNKQRHFLSGKALAIIIQRLLCQGGRISQDIQQPCHEEPHSWSMKQAGLFHEAIHKTKRSFVNPNGLAFHGATSRIILRALEVMHKHFHKQNMASTSFSLSFEFFLGFSSSCFS
jgi:hypothetical protein